MRHMQPEHIIGILKLRKHKNNLPVVCFSFKTMKTIFKGNHYLILIEHLYI